MINIRLNNVKFYYKESFYIEWRKDNKFHRDEKPAFISENAYQYWFKGFLINTKWEFN